MNEKYLFGIGIVLVVMLAFVAPAAAHSVYFEPQHSSASTGNFTYVKVYLDLDAGETLLAGQLETMFDPEHADITKISKKPDEPANYSWNNFWQNLTYSENGYAWNGVADPFCEWDPVEGEWSLCSDGLIHGPAHVKICRYKIEAVGTPGTTPLVFGDEMFPDACPVCQRCKFCNVTGEALDITWVNGTFTHEGEPQPPTPKTFEKTLASGWNLISLPLTNETDMTVANIIEASLSGSYDALHKYDATTHNFVALGLSDPMENGVGYFIHMTADDTWTYQGTVEYTSMTASLVQGLNMVGWVNETDSALPGALDSISGNYRYVARWDATSQSYEVYLPGAPDAFNDFATMERGEGYFIAATADCTLTYL